MPIPPNQAKMHRINERCSAISVRTNGSLYLLLKVEVISQPMSSAFEPLQAADADGSSIGSYRIRFPSLFNELDESFMVSQIAVQ
jgi:hypothetical protein